MKAILEFNLDEHEDRVAHLRSVKSLDLVLSLHDLDQELRSKIKYAPDSESREKIEAYNEIRNFLHQTMSGYSLDFDELMY